MAARPLGEQIGRMLRERGVSTVFGIPGVHNQELYRGLGEAGISHVLARHEQGAGFMADGYARASGRPGIVYVITGPGLCNAMTPMGQAYSDSVPMLVISSCLDDAAAERGQLHQMRDQRGAAECVCDWSFEARSAEAAYRLIDRAMAEFTARRPRPKHIQVPVGVLEGPAEAAGAAPPASRPAPPAAADADALAAALSGAARPLLILGGGAAEGAEAWREVARRCGAASFATRAGGGIMGRGAPLDYGCFLPRPGSADAIAEADLVVAVGTELSGNDLWRDELGGDAPLWRIDIDPESLSDARRAVRAIQCDAAGMARALLERDLDAAQGWSADAVAAARAQWRAEADAVRPGPTAICGALAAAMPEDLMVYSDMTQFAYVACEVWDMPGPGLWHHPTGFGTLGYALPAAIGGALARPGRPTMAIAGDYGFQYTVQELGTAVELGLGLPILLWDNTALKEIRDSMERAQIAPFAVDLRNPDFCALARAYGARAVEPGSLDELAAAVREALEADVPTLIRATPALAG